MKTILDILILIPFATFGILAVAANLFRDKGKRLPETTGREELNGD